MRYVIALLLSLVPSLAHANWYEQQQLTPLTKKLYELAWGSCCDLGDVCKDCVVYHHASKPPWKGTFWYKQDGVEKEIPAHIIEYVAWTPTGKPVLFLAPYTSGKVQKGEPVCLKIPGGGT